MRTELFNVTTDSIGEIWREYKVDLSLDEARLWVNRLRDVGPTLAVAQLEEFDRLYVGNGVAYVPNPKGDSSYCKTGVSYLNLGEAYTPTLCWFHQWNVFMYIGWGDALEMMENFHE